MNELFGNLQIRRSSYYSSFTLRCNWRIQNAGISQAVALVSLQELYLSSYRRVCSVHGRDIISFPFVIVFFYFL